MQQPASNFNTYLQSFDFVQQWLGSVWYSPKMSSLCAHDCTGGHVTGAGNLNLSLHRAGLTQALFTGDRVGP